MAMTPAQRKRRERNKIKDMGISVMTLSLTSVERALIRIAAYAAGYEDQTEYILDLVRKDRDESQQQTESCPDCRGRGCFSCCNTEAEIRMRDKARLQ